MDRIDRKILDILQKDARAPLKEIADRVFLSSPAVSARMARLESSGAIMSYQAQVAAPMLGYMVKAFINLDMDPQRKPEFYPYIESCPHVVECNCVTGDYSMLIEVLFATTQELDQFINHLQQFGRTRTQIVFSTPVEHEYLVKPICVGFVLEMIHSILAHLVTARQRSVGILASLTQIVAILVSVHYIIYIARNLVNTKVTGVVHLQRLVFLTILGSDNNDTIRSTGTIDGTRRSILQNLDGLDIIRREVTDSGTHWHTIDDIKRSCATERTDTTNSHTRICTRLTV